MKLSIEVTAESTNIEVDFAIETLKAYREMRELVSKVEQNGNPNMGVPFTPKVEQQVAPVAKTSAPKAVLPSPQVEAKPAPVAPMQPVYVQPTVVPAMPAVPQVAPPMFKSPTGRIEHAVTNLSAPVSPGQAPDMFSPSNMALLAERKVQAERTASAQQAHTAPPFSPVVAPEQQMSQPAPTPVFQIANPNQVVAFSPPTFR